ncbi:hypothetical protein [Bacillus cihuensis]|uniref:hypothetical protein n=1 Tax=Bacillus cihuensis TaxID=1208599 RepID=UPI000413ED0F|nr:hypothetical protein [Bacillus cihuensis]
MNNEQKLEIVSKALGNGAEVSLSFHHIIGIDKAEKLVTDLVPANLIEHYENDGSKWFSYRCRESDIAITAFYDNSLEERRLYEMREFEKFMDDDVRLDGMADA